MAVHGIAFSSFAVSCEQHNLITKLHLSFSTCTGGREDVLLHPMSSYAPISSCPWGSGGCMWVLVPAEQQLLPLSPSPSQRLPGWLARGPHPGVGAQLHPSDGALHFPSETRARRCSQQEKTQHGTQRARLAPSPAQAPACRAEPCHPVAGVAHSPAPSPPQGCLPTCL